MPGDPDVHFNSLHSLQSYKGDLKILYGPIYIDHSTCLITTLTPTVEHLTCKFGSPTAQQVLPSSETARNGMTKTVEIRIFLGFDN